MKTIRILIDAFHGKGYRGHKSQEAQKKFADSLLKIADKAFWAPMTYLGVSLYQEKTLSGLGVLFCVSFIIIAVSLRHQGLKVFDLHDEDNKKKAKNEKLSSKKG